MGAQAAPATKKGTSGEQGQPTASACGTPAAHFVAESFPAFHEMTNADVFALTRRRRLEAIAERRAHLFGKYGPTIYGQRAVAEFIRAREALPVVAKPKKRPSRRPGAGRIARKAVAWEARAQFLDAERMSGRLQRILDMQENCCYLCGEPFTKEGGPTLEHVMPVSRGGRNRGNVLLAHGTCNHAKADRLPTADERAYLARVNYALANESYDRIDGPKTKAETARAEKARLRRPMSRRLKWFLAIGVLLGTVALIELASMILYGRPS